MLQLPSHTHIQTRVFEGRAATTKFSASWHYPRGSSKEVELGVQTDSLMLSSCEPSSFEWLIPVSDALVNAFDLEILAS